MIVKTKRGYQVRSEDGSKNLSAPDLSEEDAHKRLGQVEHFKNAKKKSGGLSTWAKHGGGS